MRQSDAGPGVTYQFRNAFEEHRNQTRYQRVGETHRIYDVSLGRSPFAWVCLSDERALAGVKIGVEMRRSYDRHHAGM